jgi:hypothetical protein
MRALDAYWSEGLVRLRDAAEEDERRKEEQEERR